MGDFPGPTVYLPEVIIYPHLVNAEDAATCASASAAVAAATQHGILGGARCATALRP